MNAELYESMLIQKNHGEMLNFDAISNTELAQLTEVECVSQDDVANLFGVPSSVVADRQAAYGLTEDQRFNTFVNLMEQFQVMSNLFFADIGEEQQAVLHALETELNDYIRRHGFVPSLADVLNELPYTNSLIEKYRSK